MQQEITELRQICQGDKLKYDTWYGKVVARRLSIYLTYVFIKLKIKADMVTMLFLLAGILSSIFFAFGSKGNVLSGAIMLQLWYILDHSDGEVARYNKEVSLTGAYFDYLTHYIVHPVVFFGLGWGGSKITGDMGYLLAGIAGAFGIMICGIMSDLKDVIAYRSGKVYPGVDKLRERTGESASVLLPGRIFSSFYLMSTFPVFMNVLMVSSLIDFLFDRKMTFAILLFYSALINIMWLARVTVIVLKRRIDEA